MPARTPLALVVDDDDDIRDLIALSLHAADVAVVEAASGEEALAAAAQHHPDVVTLDLSLPDLEGTEVCRRLRATSAVPVLVVTSRDTEVDRLLSQRVGADDYLVKPLLPREIRARVAALLHGSRPAAAEPDVAPSSAPADADRVRTVGRIRLDADDRTVTVGEAVLMLTPTEFDLLGALAARPGHALSRADLVREVWQQSFIESDYLVDVQVGSVRRKLRRVGAGALLRTVEGTGYALDSA